jgi:hypothetical protein
MSTKHLHNEARGYQPERKKGVPKQKSGHAEATAAGTVLMMLEHGDTPERPRKGKGKSV